MRFFSSEERKEKFYFAITMLFVAVSAYFALQFLLGEDNRGAATLTYNNPSFGDGGGITEEMAKDTMKNWQSF